MSEVQSKPINVTSNELEFSLQEAAKRRDERVKAVMADMLSGLVLPQENRAHDTQGVSEEGNLASLA
jgi:hypothetical protein